MEKLRAVHESVQQLPSQAVANGLIVGGTGMTTLQVVTEFASLIMFTVNIIAVCFGAYVTYTNWKSKRTDRRDDDA